MPKDGKDKETQEDRNKRIQEADATNAAAPADNMTTDGPGLAPGEGQPAQGSLLGAKDGQRPRGEDQEPVDGPPEPLQFQTRHDVKLMAIALEGRAADLTKMAKNVTEEGYPREARVMAGDAAALQHRVLPILRGQTQMVLATNATVQEMVEHRLVDLVEKARKGKWTDAQVAEAMARRVVIMLTAAEAAGWSAGYADRSMLTPAMVIVDAIAAVPSKVWEAAG